jgi:hypothetical protein
VTWANFIHPTCRRIEAGKAASDGANLDGIAVQSGITGSGLSL